MRSIVTIETADAPVRRDGNRTYIDIPKGVNVRLDGGAPLQPQNNEPAPYRGSEIYIAGVYGGRPPVAPDDPNELIPPTWPGAPTSREQWAAWSELERSNSMRQQLGALRQFQFDHVLLDDRILVDGVEPEGFQPMRGASHDRRFTTDGGVLRLESGQPQTVARAGGPIAQQPAPMPEGPPVVATRQIPFPLLAVEIDHAMRACDAVLLEFSIPLNYKGDPMWMGTLTGCEFPGNPQARTLAVSRNGVLVLAANPGEPAVSPQLLYTIGNPHARERGANVNFEPGDHAAVLVQSLGPADQWGGMRFALSSPRNGQS